MGKSVLAVSRRAARTLKVMLITALAVLSALVPALVVNIAMPMPVSAAIALRGSVTTGKTTGTDLTIDKPDNVVAGDVMIVNIAKVGNDWTKPSSDNWTEIDVRDLGGASARSGAVLYRVADGTEGTNFTFKLGTLTSGAVGSIVAFSGVDTSGATPFDVAPGTISVQGSVAVAADSITTASADAAVIMFGMAAGQAPTWDAWSTTSPGTLAEFYDSQADFNAASVGAAWAIKTDAGPTGAGAATLSVAERNGGILIALKPKQPTTLTVAPATGTYGDTANLTATLSPALSGKTINFMLNGVAAGTAVTDGSGVANIPTASLAGIDHGTYPNGVGASYAGEDDYSASSGTASLTVNLRTVVVAADDNGKVYGNSDPGLTYHISSGSLVAGDVFSGKIGRETGENVGTYSIRQSTLALSGNYSLSFLSGTFTISTRDIEVTANSCSKVSGEADPELTHHVSSGSLVAGDAFSGKLTREAGEDVGTYVIQQGTLALSGNYHLTFVEGTFTIRASGTGAPFPTVDSISPESGKPGDTLDVVIKGSNFEEVNTVKFGPGVTVNSFDVESSTCIVANITIDPTAGAGDNNIVLTSPQGYGQLSEAFSIKLSEGMAEAGGGRGLWLILILVLLAVALGFLIFAWFKRRKKKVEPELAPIVAPSRPPGGTREAADLEQAPMAPVDQPLQEAATAADIEQGTVSVADQPSVAAVEPEQSPEVAVAAVSQPIEEAAMAADVEQTPAVVAAKQPPQTIEEAVIPEVTPPAAVAADQPLEEIEKPTDLPQASVPAAAAPKPRRRTTKKAPASLDQSADAGEQPPRRTPRRAPASTSGRPRTPAKKRKKATG